MAKSRVGTRGCKVGGAPRSRPTPSSRGLRGRRREIGPERARFHACRRAASDHHEVRVLRERCPALAKPLPHEPLHPVPNDGSADPAAHDQSKPGPARGARDFQRERPTRPPTPLGAGSLKIPALADAIRRSKALRSTRGVRGLQGQAGLGPEGGLETYFELIVGTSRFRPLARRRFNTRRPALVLMRARKPCVRFRRIRLGWNVRFMRTFLRGGGDPAKTRRAKLPTCVPGCQGNRRHSFTRSVDDIW
jgi:hypothetical protein